MKKLSIAIAVLALAGAACSGTDDGGAITSPTATGGAPAGAVATDEVVGTTGNLWSPKHIVVAAGTTVEWEWEDAVGGHNVVFDNDLYRSGDPTGDGRASFEFNDTGIFDYYCEVHAPGGSGIMTGSVTVE